MKINNVSIVHFEDCTGCGTCSKICPHQCISMVPMGKAGFLHPTIDTNSCTDCGACFKSCPLNKPATYKVADVYAAYGKSEEILKSSNSGGVFSVIATDFLNNGGYVCGAAYTEDLDVTHIIISDIADLYKLQGSKYVQSKAFDTYPKIRDILKSGKHVLFSGTGCQIAGLKKYLRKEYDNLLTIELVCHGVPSPALFKKYLIWLGNKANGKICKYQFRSKKLRPTGEHSQFCYTVNGKEHVGQAYEDPYYGSFLSGTTLRESCYNCHFKGEERVGDLTIGDFWGIEKSHPSFSSKNGTCLVMVNTLSGHHYFEYIKDRFVYVTSNYREASLRNPSLDKPTPLPTIKIDYSAVDLFDKELRQKLSLKNKIKNHLPWQVKWFLKKYL